MLFRFSKMLCCMSICISLLCSLAYGQENFTPVEEGDYKVVKQELNIVPNVQLEGSFLASYLYISNKLFGKSESKQKAFLLEGNLLFRTIASKNISIVADITNKDNRVNKQPSAYMPHGDANKDAYYDKKPKGLNVTFDQLYLEYHSNPHSNLRIGRQTINPLDHQGLIYEGEALAISHSCLFGTWCYEIGAGKLQETGHNELYWGGLSYPFLSNNQTVTSVDLNPVSRPDEELRIGVYYAIYSASSVPVDINGNWVAENSQEQALSNNTNTAGSVFARIHNTKYIGFQANWNYHKLLFAMDSALMLSKRDYQEVNQTTNASTTIASQTLQGTAIKLKASIYPKDNVVIQATWFNATGNQAKLGESVWNEKGGFQSINSGRYGDALIYLKGYQEQGQHHSITGLRYFSIAGKYLPYKSILIKSAVYNFSNTAGVVNEAGEANKQIGTEFDLSLNWAIQDKLIANAYAAYMLAGKGYSRSDVIKPTEEKPKNDILIALNVGYSF